MSLNFIQNKITLVQKYLTLKMNKTFYIVCVLIVFTSCKSVKSYNAKIAERHSVKDLRQDVDAVYNVLQRDHPRLYQYTSKAILDFKIDSLKKTINTPLNSRGFYKKIAPVISAVRQGHLSVSSANKKFTKKEYKALKKNTFEFYNLDFEYFDNKLWVLNSHGKESSYLGHQVVKINEAPMDSLWHVYKTRFASDGYNKTLQNRALGRYFSSFYYKDKGFVDSLKITFKYKDSLFTKTMKRIPKNEKKLCNDTLKIKKTKLAKTEKRRARIQNKEKRKNNRTRGFDAQRNEYNRNFEFIGKDTSVAYMNIRSFTKGNYKKFYKTSFKKIDSAQTTNFILDLRNNGGGRVAEIDYLYAHLTNKPYTFIAPSQVTRRTPIFNYTMTHSNGLKLLGVVLSPLILVADLLHTQKKEGEFYFKFRQTKTRQPKDLNFKGPMYVLINGNSFSASSLISTHLKAKKRAIFVGEETGGAYNGCVAGFYKNYELPTSKLNVRLGLMQIEAPYKQLPDGYGIKPDIEILPTIEDRLLNYDPELNWVLQDIYK